MKKDKINNFPPKIKNQLEKPTGLAPNEIFAPSEEGEGQTLAESYREADVHSVSISTGNTSKFWEKFAQQMINKDVRKKMTWIISFYHPSTKAWNGWTTRKASFEKELKNYNLFLDKGIEFIIREKDPIERR